MASIDASASTFRVEPARGRPAPLLVEVPHAGTRVPDDVAAGLCIEPHDVLHDADLFVDELYRAAPDHGGTMLVAETSRYVVDLNRFEHDVDASALTQPSLGRAHLPRGLIWCETTDGRPVLRRPLTPAELDARLARFYRPYHEALSAQIDALRARFGYVVLLSAHSMPSTGRLATHEPVERRADIVPGTRGRTTAHARVIDAVETHFRSAGLSVRHDDPYRGGATTARWGLPHEGVHAIQIELNRALYMDEGPLTRRRDGFRWLTELCEALCAKLAAVELPEARRGR